MPNDHSESIYCDELVWLQHDTEPLTVANDKLNLRRTRKISHNRIQLPIRLWLWVTERCLRFRTCLLCRLAVLFGSKTIRNPSTYLRTEHVLTLEI